MPIKKQKKKKNKVVKQFLSLEVLFFLAADIADKSKDKVLREKFGRIEKSYNKYVMALNTNEEDTRQRAVILRKQLSLFLQTNKN